jgi:hypothetical protein
MSTANAPATASAGSSDLNAVTQSKYLTLHLRPTQGLRNLHHPPLNYLVMPIVLDRLTMQLANLKVMLEEAVKNNRPFLEQARISKQIVELEHSIEKRKEFLKRQDSTN